MKHNYNVNNKRILIQDVITKNDLVSMFKRMGIYKGMILYVQSDLEKCAYVNGGPQIIIDALIECVGYEGTIVTPSFTLSSVDPACDRTYLFERDVFEEIRESKPAFHKKRTPSECGEFSRQLMCNEGVYRSNHPTHSILAWGKYAKLICDRHPLHFSLGKDSPLEKVVEMNGYVLLLGSTFQECDILSYASVVSGKNQIHIVSAPIEKKGEREFISMLEMDYNLKNVHMIYDMMMERDVVKNDYLANAQCMFFNAKEVSTLAQGFFNSFR